ncbi:MAG: hypothetical protein EAZ09_03605 [Oscillatoriales cyanobacterium]|nr:MAG: hypothetical protein EAZ18_00890 [Oscillatoriales cyanobacterium]TAH24592.1 MAG: hypothetical protein EAZ09_03605 [Oscillatoriales cyanobacterium]
MRPHARTLKERTYEHQPTALPHGIQLYLLLYLLLYLKKQVRQLKRQVRQQVMLQVELHPIHIRAIALKLKTQLWQSQNFQRPLTYLTNSKLSAKSLRQMWGM